jgi:hypothetical protein
MPRGAAAAGATPGLRFRPPPPGAMLMRLASASVGAREGRPVCRAERQAGRDGAVSKHRWQQCQALAAAIQAGPEQRW